MTDDPFAAERLRQEMLQKQRAAVADILNNLENPFEKNPIPPPSGPLRWSYYGGFREMNFSPKRADGGRT